MRIIELEIEFCMVSDGGFVIGKASVVRSPSDESNAGVINKIPVELPTIVRDGGSIYPINHDSGMEGG